MSLTKKERKEINNLLFDWLEDSNTYDFKKVLNYLEQKKKEWQEEAYEEGSEDANFNNHVESDLSLD